MQGADESQGPGWWQASDGKWYPPEAQPGTRPPMSTAPPVPTGLPPVSNGGVEGGAFLKRLFDVSMTTFITPSIIRVLFIIAIAVTSLFALISLVSSLAALGDSPGIGLLGIVLTLVFWLLGIIYWRVILELVIVLFRIERNTRRDDHSDT